MSEMMKNHMNVENIYPVESPHFDPELWREITNEEEVENDESLKALKAEENDESLKALKADLKVFQDCYNQNREDVENLRKLASTMIDLALTLCLDNLVESHMLNLLQDAISKLEEALKINMNDHEAIFLKGKAHYHILSMDLLDKHADPYLEQCKKAFECIKDLVEHKAPNLYENVHMLENIRKFFPPGWDPESSDKFKTIQNPPLRLSYYEQKQNMKEEMIQEAVEKLLEAMSINPDDNNRKLVDKLASQIYSNPWTGNKELIRYREELLASVKVAKEALSGKRPLNAGELKNGALASIFLWDMPTRELDSDKAVMKRNKLLPDAISMLDEVLLIDPNDYQAMIYLGKLHYYLLMDSTIHMDSEDSLDHCQKAINCFSNGRDKAPTVYRDFDLVEEAENLLATLSSFESSKWRKHAKIMINSSVASLALNENVMLTKFIGVLFEAMSLGTYERYKTAGEKSVKMHLSQELVSVFGQVDFVMRDVIMNGPKSP